LTLLDANILLHAYNTSSPQHERARLWIESALSGAAPVRISWVTLLAFLRISTNPRAYPRPFLPAEASGIVTEWLARPCFGILEPGDRHWEILRQLMTLGQTRGPLVMDAHLAALAIEHGATLASTDRDFARFPDLKWINPLETTL
jgi:hypothetical protein